MDNVAIYCGRVVDKKNFRTFVYDVSGNKKLVESWSEFETAMASGLWFDTIEIATKSKPKRQSKLKSILNSDDTLQNEVN